MRVVGFLVAAALLLATMALAGPARAHQPVVLGPGDGTPLTGPLLTDGTVSYAVRAEVAMGQQRGFRFVLKAGDRLAMQLLIFDEPPANALAPSALPRVTMIDPTGRSTTLAVNERTEFYEPYSKKTYLFLSRIDRSAVPGTYRVIVRGRSVTPVDATVAVGYREVPGRVIE